MLDTIRRAVSQFALGEGGRVEEQKALPFAWTAGLMVGAAAVVSAPGVAEAEICNDTQVILDECMAECQNYCYFWDRSCDWRCLTERVCDCY